MKISEKQARKLGFFPEKSKKPGKMKFGNIRTRLDGYLFDSKVEARYYGNYIKPRLMAGEIIDLVIHPRYDLHVEGFKICAVIFDFEYTIKETLERVIDDVKGADNEKSKRKRQHFEAQYGRKVNLIKTKDVRQ